MSRDASNIEENSDLKVCSLSLVLVEVCTQEREFSSGSDEGIISFGPHSILAGD